MNGYDYAGDELEVFAQARHWKAYYGHFLRPWLRGRVLEVGAGLGATTRALCDGSQEDWWCLEPDARMAQGIEAAIAAGRLPACCRAVPGTVATLDPGTGFDAILYIDVLEHIGEDRVELERAAVRLAAGGALIVLAPAHPWLYSPFDRAIGHLRRYTRASLARIAPPSLRLERLHYLDAMGLFASLGNKWFLRRSTPGRQQIAFWDRIMVPLSRRIDWLVGYRAGRSLLAVWTRLAGPDA